MTQIDQAISTLQEIARALHDADKTNTNLVVATIILAVATIVFGTLSLLFTKWQVTRSEQRQEERFQEQAKRQDDEQFERMRPWITIEKPLPELVEFIDQTSMEWSGFNDALRRKDALPKIQFIKYTYTFTNHGERAAKNLKRTQILRSQPITRQELESTAENDLNMDLGPNQSQSAINIYSLEDYLKLNEVPWYLGCKISYDNGKFRSTSIIIYKITLSQVTQIEMRYT